MLKIKRDDEVIVIAERTKVSVALFSRFWTMVASSLLASTWLRNMLRPILTVVLKAAS